MQRTPLPDFQIAVIGDMHMQFDGEDVAYFNTSKYDLIIFVGDIGARNPDSLYRVLPIINRLEKPTYLIPGNHDTTGVRQLLGELTQNNLLINFGAGAQDGRMARLRDGLSNTTLCGYSRHQLLDGLEIVAARPFSMGSLNQTVNFRPYLEKQYGIGTLEQSRDRILQLIEESTAPYLLLAHHGPHGLGSRPTDMFGADFLPQETDFGDSDLRWAIDQAIGFGKSPIAVLAGHMHYPTKHGKKPKQWRTDRNGILYINAARWPRIFRHEEHTFHHHIRLSYSQVSGLIANAVFVSGDQEIGIENEFQNTP